MNRSRPERTVGQQRRKAIPQHSPERTCIGCRAPGGARDLLRFACTPAGEVILDLSGRAPGRGAYVCCDVRCLRQALKPARLAMALKRSVTVPDIEVLYQAVRGLLYRRLGAYLGLGQKAGAVISGYAQLRRALGQRRVLYMILATDTASGRAEEYRSWCAQYNVPYVVLLTKEELGRMLGQPSRSALGLTVPRLVESLCVILVSLERLQVAFPRSEVRASLP